MRNSFLWNRLRSQQLGVKFVRQFPIGPPIADFACRSLKLVIELDGGQHCPEVDAARTSSLEQFGFPLVRFWNHEVLTNIDGVLSAILHEIKQHR